LPLLIEKGEVTKTIAAVDYSNTAMVASCGHLIPPQTSKSGEVGAKDVVATRHIHAPWSGFDEALETTKENNNSKSSNDIFGSYFADGSFYQFLLQRMKPRTANETIRYAKKFVHVLENDDASELLSFNPHKRIHIMKALASLSRFVGRYDVWLQIRHRYNLKWSTGNESLLTFERFFNDDSCTLENMLKWVRHSIDWLSDDEGKVLLFNCLTGLRAAEAIEAIRLINNDNCKTDKIQYYNPERQCLEHFRFPEIFLRRTKAAYVSLVDDEIIGIAKSIDKTPSYDSLRMHCSRRSASMNMNYCRKIYASYLRQSGIETEIIDLLQGRVPKSVFARHYFRPSADYKDRVLAALKTLKQKILY
jgi:hypothetical protein